jgi:hypothetical protein
MIATSAIMHQAEPINVLDVWKNVVAFLFSDKDIEVNLIKHAHNKLLFSSSRHAFVKMSRKYCHQTEYYLQKLRKS